MRLAGLDAQRSAAHRRGAPERHLQVLDVQERVIAAAPVPSRVAQAVATRLMPSTSVNSAGPE